ncbi:hypothetical protein F66182_9929 [Fusarium sp. NRRL 66182]|nr:hypothetical protein F66182_9929 [Fusarium sp. NRRL 66182]
MTLLCSRTEIVTIFETILTSQNEGKWDTLGSLVQPTVTINNIAQQRDVFIAGLHSAIENEVILSRLDSCVVDVNTQAIAARIIKSPDALTQESRQYQEITLAWFVDGRLSALKTLQDNDARRAGRGVEAKTPAHHLESTPTSLHLEAVYRDYIRSINDKTMESSFEKFCQPSVTHNAKTRTVAEYISLIQESQTAIDSLHFDIQDLVVDNESGRLAARLEFTGLPVKRWADAEPNGKHVKFHEHVMYWFDKGKIHWVWSIVDLDSYRNQLQES